MGDSEQFMLIYNPREADSPEKRTILQRRNRCPKITVRPGESKELVPDGVSPFFPFFPSGKM